MIDPYFFSDISQTRGLKVFSCFSCGGGSSIGYKLAGLDVLGGCDIDPQMAKHYKQNLNPKFFFLMPVCDLLDCDLPVDFYNLDILDGSPPCSTFSLAGSREKDWGKSRKFREGQADQILSDLFFDFINVAKELRPKIVVSENVMGILAGNAKGYVKLILEAFDQAGYFTQVFIVSALDCGVPQSRKRVFFVSRRKDLRLKELKLKFKSFSGLTCGKALLGLNQIQLDASLFLNNETEAFRRWARTPPGNNFKFEKETGFFTHVKFSKGLPAPTIIATDTYYHWGEPRKFSFEEMKRFFLFPDDYWAESQSIGKYLLGMSVPPFMTKTLAENISSQWF